MGPISIGLALLTAALWGGTPVAIRYSVDTLPPVAVAGIRFAMATLVMLVWCRMQGTPLRLQPGQRLPPILLGALLFVQISLFNIGIHRSSASHAAVFINTFAFWVAGIEHLIARSHRISPGKWFGLLLAVCGAGLTLGVSGDGQTPGTGGDKPSLAGDAILILSGLILGIKIAYTKHAVRTVEPSKLLLWHDVVGVGLFAVFSLLFEDVTRRDFTLPAVLGLVYQGVVVAGICFAIQTELLRRHPAWQVSVYSCATPLFGLIAAATLRGDPLSIWLVVSGVAVAAGILVISATPQNGRTNT